MMTMRHCIPVQAIQRRRCVLSFCFVDYKDDELSEIIEDEDGDKVQIEALFDRKPYQESDGKRHGD